MDGIILYTSQYAAISRLSIEQKGRLLDCIFLKALGEPIDISDDPVLAMAFAFVEERMDSNAAKYEQIVEKRREAGRKGAIKTNQKRWGDNQQLSAESANADNCRQNRQTSAKSANSNSNSKSNSKSIDTPVSKDTSVSDNNLFSDLDKSKSLSFENDAEAKFHKEIIRFFNDTIKNSKSQIPVIKTIAGQRKGFLNGRMREYGKDAVLTVIKKAAVSDFLNGCGNKAFVASFDWIFRPTNFPKVLEGNYDNKIKKPDMSVGVNWHKTGDDYYDETKKNLW